MRSSRYPVLMLGLGAWVVACAGEEFVTSGGGTATSVTTGGDPSATSGVTSGEGGSTAVGTTSAGEGGATSASATTTSAESVATSSGAGGASVASSSGVGGDATSSATSVVSSSASTGGGPTCDDLLNDIKTKLAKAQECSLQLPVVQCEDLVDGLCCDVVVADHNSLATAEYLDALNAFQQAGCQVACPRAPCNVSPGACQPSNDDPAQGVCVQG